MKVYADESVDRPIVDRLRHEGHEVEYVAEMNPGIMDDEVFARGQRSGRTADDLGQ